MQMRRWLAAPAVLGVLFSLAINGGSAQDAKPVHEKHDQSALFYSLREVIVIGIDLYNNQGDHAGCYRVFHGSLVSVKPFLSADLKKKIDDSLKAAERMPLMADRAFELRKALDEIRTAVNPANTAKTDAKKDEKKTETKTDTKEKKGEPKVEEKKPAPKIETKSDKQPEEKKVEPKKVEEKKIEEKKTEAKKVEAKKVESKNTEPKKIEEKKKEETKVQPKLESKNNDVKNSEAKNAGNLAGTITFQSQPLAAGNFLTLVSKDGKKFSTLVQKAGSFSFSTPVPPGEYRIMVEPAPGSPPAGTPLPEQFRNENTSGLSITVQAGRQNLQLQLVR